MGNRTVCEILLDILAEAGVKHIFGIPGDAINNLVEAIRNQDNITFIQVRHEEAGAFAASAQAKLTGRLAVCVGTAGPGAIHLLNGLYDAKLDHAPVLAITGQVETEYIGTDFPYHDFYPDGKPAVQIDVDLTRIGKRYPVTVGLAGHAGPTLEALMQRLNPKNNGDYLEELQRKMNDWREEMKSSEFSRKTPVKPQALARAIGEAAKDDAVFICDTGAVTVWAARHLPVGGNQRFTLSSALASMGFGLPGAIGAQLAFPKRQVIALCGDGGFAMLMSDFLTAVKYELPIKVVVFNNDKLGLIQMEQEVLGYPEYQTELHNPNFAKYAELCGGQGIKVTDPAEIGPALREAFSATTPFIVDVEINPEEVTMPPRVKVKQALGYGMAKVREFVGSEK